MGSLGRGSKLQDVDLAILDNHGTAWRQAVNILVVETQLRQCHAFAGGGEHGAFDREAQRADTQWVAGHEHVTLGIEKHDVVGPVQPGCDSTEHVEQVGSLVASEFLAQQVHQDLGVGLTGEMEIGMREDFLAELGVVGQLAVEGETEPL